MHCKDLHKVLDRLRRKFGTLVKVLGVRDSRQIYAKLYYGVVGLSRVMGIGMGNG